MLYPNPITFVKTFIVVQLIFYMILRIRFLHCLFPSYVISLIVIIIESCVNVQKYKNECQVIINDLREHYKN